MLKVTIDCNEKKKKKESVQGRGSQPGAPLNFQGGCINYISTLLFVIKKMGVFKYCVGQWMASESKRLRTTGLLAE